ncbi:MAG: hypothetical protein B6D39_09860 [Anaerolineae bacterium UTCFX2]|jgi:uncharacterized protein YlxP (DUF503 family)|nr:DUF503 domain-containing protein [Anaerolineales bacterium]OQY89263.1 MAG: hypothetical protein B6D39_09860 [Anaerolineae bacterium UTCFX2]
MPVGILTVQLELAGCGSLKEKRGRLQPLLTRLQREFNISIAEVDFLDSWQSALVACAVVSNNGRHNQRSLQQVVRWIEENWPDVEVVDERIELLF